MASVLVENIPFQEGFAAVADTAPEFDIDLVLLVLEHDHSFSSFPSSDEHYWNALYHE